MNIQNNAPATSLRQRMTEDMVARNLGPHSQRNYLNSCARFAAFLGRSPEAATADDIRRFQLFLIESGASIVHRNRIMTGVKFLLRVTLRRHDLAAEIYQLKEPQKIPLVMSQDEVKRLLAVAASPKVRAMLSLAYGCGLRAGEVVRPASPSTASMPASPTKPPSRLSPRRSAAPNGPSTPRSPSPDRRRCSPISAVTPTAPPSRTAA